MSPKACVMQVMRLSLEEAGRNQEEKMVVWVAQEVDGSRVTGYWFAKFNHMKRDEEDGTHRPSSGLQQTAHKLLSTSPAWLRGMSIDCVCAK
jgi:hypothetical protein